MAARRATGLLIALALAAAPAARAVTVAGVAFPDQVDEAGDTLHLNGAGVRVFFGFVRGYASALYVGAPSHDAETILDEPNPKVLKTEYLHDAGIGQLRQEFAYVHDHYCAKNACPAANEASYHRMLAALTPVAKGETTTYVITDTGFEIIRDGRNSMTIDNPTYGRSFLAAVIGATSPTPGYRAGLLGKPG